MSNQELFSQRGSYLAPVVMAHGQGGAEIREDQIPTLTCNHEAPILASGFHGDVDRTLTARHDSSPCADRGMDVVAIGFNARQDPDSWEGRTGPLDTDGGTQAVAVPLLEVGKRTGTSTTDPRAGIGIAEDGDPMYTLQGGAQHGVAVAYGIYGDTTTKVGEDVQPTLRAREKGGGSAAFVSYGMQVRRLTPTECERLQGFPDGHTRIPWRGKGAEDCPDGPRYKALGNSMAVPVMRWIGARIARQLEAQV